MQAYSAGCSGGSGNDFVKLFDEPKAFFDLNRLMDADEATFDLIRCNDTYALNICQNRHRCFQL